MTRTLPRALLFAAVLVLLAACAGSGGRLQQAGDAAVFDLGLETSLDWARIRAARMEQWTIDGTPLNQLIIISKVRDKEHVFLNVRETRSRPDGPWFRAGMRPDEVRDLILDGLRGSGWANVSAGNLRPAPFGSVPGLRFEIDLDNPSGLVYKGMAAAAERDGRLTLLIFLAPAEHYYDRDAAAVSKMFDSLRFVR